jgi:hypothetical protein
VRDQVSHPYKTTRTITVTWYTHINITIIQPLFAALPFVQIWQPLPLSRIPVQLK